MVPGKILVEWDVDGRLSIKTSRAVNSGESRKLTVRVLLDAAKAINESGSALEVPIGAAPVRILAGG